MRVAFALAVAAMLAGCGGSSAPRPEPPERPLRLNQIELEMIEDPNRSRPVRVELVRVADMRLLPEILRINTNGWFGQTGQAFKSAHPEAIFDSWEVVPGTAIGPFEVEIDEDVAGVLFCDTLTAPPPLRFELDGAVRVTINNDGCELSGGEPSRSGVNWLFWRR